MSLHTSCSEVVKRGFPRVSGDEPVHDMQHDVDDEFSPRERG